MMRKVIVLNEFADRDCFSRRYTVGEELDGFSADRIDELLSRGLVRIEERETDIRHLNVSDLLPMIAAMTETDQLERLLLLENESDKPRSTVVKALEGRLSHLSEKD